MSMSAAQLEFEIKKLSNQHTDWSLPVIVIKTLLEFTRQYKFKTFVEFMQTIEQITCVLKDQNISYNAGIDLFINYCGNVTDVEYIIKGIEEFIANCGSFRAECISLGKKVIMPKSSILLHSYSTMATRFKLFNDRLAIELGLRVYVTECGRGEEAYRDMKQAGLEVYKIPLAVISYILPKVDYCLVGAEGVVRSGGIVNRIGTFPIALCAKQAQKPFYCIAESYKFVDKYPLGMDDLEFENAKGVFGKNVVLPTIDYTPPELITLFFTNEGIMTPIAVSELFLKSSM